MQVFEHAGHSFLNYPYLNWRVVCFYCDNSNCRMGDASDQHEVLMEATEPIVVNYEHDDEELSEIRSTSHKHEKVRAYTAKFKIETVQYAEKNYISEAAKKFKVDRHTVRDLNTRKSKYLLWFHVVVKAVNDSMVEVKKNLSELLEERVLDWITDRRSKWLRVSRKLIMKKSKVMYMDMRENSSLAHDGDFVASTGWLNNVMKRHGLSLRRKTTVAQKDPDNLIGKLVSYILRVRKLRQNFDYQPRDIIAFDETPVCADMVSTTTVDWRGAKEVTLKTTGHEKCRISVGLAAKGDGSKLKPIIIFKDAKREVAALQK